MAHIRSLYLTITIALVSLGPMALGGGVPCFSDSCEAGRFCDALEGRCSPCTHAVCHLDTQPPECQYFCTALANAISQGPGSVALTVTSSRGLVLHQILTITIIAILILNVICNFANTKLLITIRDYQSLKRKTGDRYQNNVGLLPNTSCVEVPMSGDKPKSFQEIHESVDVSREETATAGEADGPSLRYDFIQSYPPSSGHTDSQWDNDCPPLCLSERQCDGNCPTHTTDQSSSVRLSVMDMPYPRDVQMFHGMREAEETAPKTANAV